MDRRSQKTSLSRSGFPIMASVYIVAATVFLVAGQAWAGTPSASEASSVVSPPARSSPIRIGVLAHKGVDTCKEMWQPTISYLETAMPNRRFELVPLKFDAVEPAVKSESIDFLICHAAMYVNMEVEYGVSRIMTLRVRAGNHIVSEYGGVIFCRSDRADLRRLSDVSGKRLAAVDQLAFGGWLMALREFKAAGINPERDCAQVSFLDTHADVVRAVLSGAADIGTVRSDILEGMAERGELRMDALQIIPAGSLTPDTSVYPYVHSTRLYPEWPLAKLKRTSDELASALTVALLSMPADSPAAMAAHSGGWGVCLDYNSVHDALRELQVEPYENYGKIGLWDLWRQYWHWLLAASALILSLLTALLALRRKQHVILLINGRNRSILESAGEAILGVDTKGITTFVNPSAERMLGYSASELLGNRLHDLTHHTKPDGSPYPCEECPVYAAFRDGVVHQGDDQYFIRKDGTLFPVTYSSRPLIESGKIIGAVVCFQDITEQKWMSKALEIVADVNGSMAELSGAVVGSFSTQQVSDLVLEHGKHLTHSRFGFVGFIDPCVNRLVYASMTDDSWKAGEPADKGAISHAFDGLCRWVLNHRKPLLANAMKDLPDSAEVPQGLLPDQRFLSVPAMIEDTMVGQITLANSTHPYTKADLDVVERLASIYALAIQQQRAREAIQESARFAHATLDAIPSQIAIVDQQGVILAVNHSWNKFALNNGGVPDTVGDGVNYLHVCEVAARAGDPHAVVFAQGMGDVMADRKAEFKMEYPCHSPCEERWFIARITRFAGDGPTRLVVTHENITDRKLIETEAAGRARIEAERDRLQEAIRALEQVLGVVGHELRTPLAGIRAMAEFLMTEDGQHTQQCDSFLQSMQTEAVRMADMVNNLLEAARLNSGTARWNWSLVSLKEVCEDAIAGLRPLVDPSSVALACTIEPDDLTMQGDGGAILRMLINLMNNAAKHTKEGSISIAVRRDQQDDCLVEIHVRDTGAGISVALAGKLGEAFALNSGALGAGHIQGSGLGLSICRAIVAAHGGRMRIESALGQGTCITALLRMDLEGPIANPQGVEIERRIV